MEFTGYNNPLFPIHKTNFVLVLTLSVLLMWNNAELRWEEEIKNSVWKE